MINLCYGTLDLNHFIIYFHLYHGILHLNHFIIYIWLYAYIKPNIFWLPCYARPSRARRPLPSGLPVYVLVETRSAVAQCPRTVASLPEQARHGRPGNQVYFGMKEVQSISFKE